VMRKPNVPYTDQQAIKDSIVSYMKKNGIVE